MSRKKMIHSTRWGRFGLSLAIAICMTMSLGVQAKAEEVAKIGAFYALSGGVAEAASWVVEGIKLAEEEINAKGGITIQGKKMKIKVIMYDDKCDPTTAVSAVEKLINRDKVIALNGSYCSSCTLAAMEVSDPKKVLLLNSVSVHPKITAPGYPYTFRTGNTIDMYAKPYVEFVTKQLPHVKSVALIAITDDYGRGAVDIYSKLFPENGIKVETIQYFKHGDTDFYTQITKIVSKSPDAIYIVTDEDAQNIGILKQLKELGFKGEILGCSTYATDHMVELGGKELLEGIYMEGINFELYKNEPAMQAWLKRYKNKFGREGNGFSISGYYAIELLSYVIEKANTLTEHEKIRDAMQQADLNNCITGFFGKPHFDENGQARPFLGALQYQDGKRVTAYREKF
jgi:branched-chain amino acid transport system substrate-binding protein